MTQIYLVDVPPFLTASGTWEYLVRFSSREEAVAFVIKYYGADNEGRVYSISEDEGDSN